MYHTCMYLWISTTRHYFNMDNKLQELLTLLSLLAAVVQLNSAFYHHVTTVHVRRRKDKMIIQWTSTVTMLSCGTLSTELWLQRNGDKTFTCRSRSTWTKKCVCMWRERRQCGRSWMFFYKSDLHIVLTQFEIRSNSIQFDSIQNMVH